MMNEIQIKSTIYSHKIKKKKKQIYITTVICQIKVIAYDYYDI